MYVTACGSAGFTGSLGGIYDHLGWGLGTKKARTILTVAGLVLGLGLLFTGRSKGRMNASTENLRREQNSKHKKYSIA